MSRFNLRQRGFRLLIVLRDAACKFIHNDAALIAGTLAYNVLLAFFPFLIFLTSLTGILGDTFAVQQLIDKAIYYAPTEVADVLRPVISEVINIREGSLLTLGLIGTLWILVGGVEAFRSGLNRAYEVQEKRGFFFRKAQSLIFVFMLATALIAMSMAIIFGPLLFEAAVSFLQLSHWLEILWNIVRYLSAFSLMVGMMSVVYFYLPNVKQHWKRTLPGAIFATLTWLMLASLFSVYLGYAQDFSVTYGSLGGVIVSMVFFQLSAVVFLFGAEINYVLLTAYEKGIEKVSVDRDKKES